MRRKKLPQKGWNKDRPFGLGGPLNSGHGDLAPARGALSMQDAPPLSSSQSPLSSVSACGENCACSLAPQGHFRAHLVGLGAPPLPTARGAAGAPHRDIKKKMRRARWKRKRRFGGSVCASADLLPPARDGWLSRVVVRDGNAQPLGKPPARGSWGYPLLLFSLPLAGGR